MRSAKWAAALGFILAASPGWAGWEIEHTNYSLRSSGKEIGRSSSTMWVSKQRIRTDDGMTVSIYDYDRERITLLLPQKKIYWAGTVDEYLSAIRVSNPKRRALPGQLDLPKPKVAVTETPITAEIAGKPTKKYVILNDTRPFQEIWVGDPFLAKDLDLARYQSVQRKMSETVRSSYATALTVLSNDPLYKKMNIEGYPLRTHTYLGDALIGSEVVRITPKDVPDSQFATPAGYSQISLVALIDAQQQIRDVEMTEHMKARERQKPARRTPGARKGKGDAQKK